VIILKYFLEAQILNIHDLYTNLNYLSSSVKVKKFLKILPLSAHLSNAEV
jgi:hypothetical protein